MVLSFYGWIKLSMMQYFQGTKYAVKLKELSLLQCGQKKNYKGKTNF